MNENIEKSAAYRSPSTEMAPFGVATTAGTKARYGTLKPLGPSHIAAIEERGLDPETVVRHGVGASATLRGDCIGIPYFENGQRVGTKYRTLTGEKAFAQDKGSKQILWNVDCLRDETLKGEPLIVTEGEMDALAALQAGFHRVVSVPGGAPAESISDDGGKKYQFLDEPLLKDCSEIILAVDSDGPGANLLQDLSVRLGRHRCKWLKYPRPPKGENCKDLNDALRHYGIEGVRETIKRAQWCKVNGVYRLSELPPVDTPPALDIGIVGLAEHYKIRRGDFCVITGLPGHGKSSFVNEVACRMAASHGWTTVFASFEQAPQVDHRRALRSFRSGRLEKYMRLDELADADQWIDQHFAFLVPDEDEDPTLKWMLERLAAAIIRYGASMVVVDPFNEMSMEDRPPDMTMTEYVGYTIKQFKKLARKYRVHFVLVAHPAKMQRGKDNTYPVPGLWDIADSAQFNNKADVGIVVHRPDISKNSETIIRVVKSRYFNQIGRPGEIKGRWQDDQTKFTIVDDGAGMNDDI